MLKELVDAIKSTAEHIKNIKTFRYEGRDLINTQNNNSTIQVIVEDDIYSEYILTKDILKVTVNIDILDNVFQEQDKLDIHDNCNKIAVVLMKLLETKYKNIINVYDFSIMTLSNYTDDDLYGVRLTLMLHMPSPINACNISDYIDELNKYEKEKDDGITINAPKIDITTIDINPIKLNRNEKRRR